MKRVFFLLPIFMFSCMASAQEMKENELAECYVALVNEYYQLRNIRSRVTLLDSKMIQQEVYEDFPDDINFDDALISSIKDNKLISMSSGILDYGYSYHFIYYDVDKCNFSRFSVDLDRLKAKANRSFDFTISSKDLPKMEFCKEELVSLTKTFVSAVEKGDTAALKPILAKRMIKGCPIEQILTGARDFYNVPLCLDRG